MLGLLAEAGGRRLELHQQLDPERRQRRFVEGLAALVVADLDADVIEHGRQPTAATIVDERATPRFQEPGWFTKHVFNRARRRAEPARAQHRRLAGARSEGAQERRVAADAGQPAARSRATATWSRPAATPSGCATCGSAAAAAWSAAAAAEEFSATEVAEAEQPALLRAYLKKWKWEVGAFFDGVGPDSSDEELRRIAPDHPVFRIEPRA